jgi:DNA polymerase-3 subunit alpha
MNPFQSIPETPGSGYVGELYARNCVEKRMLRIVLRGTGEIDRDARNVRRIHGVLRSSPGKDHFSFLICENGRQSLIEFPNVTTGITPELMQRLAERVGSENLSVEYLHYQ